MYVCFCRPTNQTPEENLKEQTIFMSVISFFLITTYIFLVFKKRKRLAKLNEEKEATDAEKTDDEEEDAIADDKDSDLL